MNKSSKIDARCPVCRQWHKLEPVALGMDITCPNCRQSVKLVPRSAQAIMFRRFLQVCIVLAGIAFFFWLYEYRQKEMEKTFNSLELPDISRQQ